jgi:hypothetical protein
MMDDNKVMGLGISGYRRYLRLHRLNNIGRDYVEIQEGLFKETTVDELFDSAAGSYEKHKDGK